MTFGRVTNSGQGPPGDGGMSTPGRAQQGEQRGASKETPTPAVAPTPTPSSSLYNYFKRPWEEEPVSLAEPDCHATKRIKREIPDI